MQTPSSSSLPPRRRTKIAKIADKAALCVSFSKRREGLFKKALELCTLTDARTAIIVFSNTGRLYSFGEPSADQIISDYLRSNGGMEGYPCMMEGVLDSLIAKYEAVLDCVRKQLKDVRAGGDSGVGVGCDSEVLNDDEIDSLLQGFKASRPSLFALFKDYVRHGDCDGESSGKEPTESDPEAGGYNPEKFAALEDLDVSLLM